MKNTIARINDFMDYFVVVQGEMTIEQINDAYEKAGDLFNQYFDPKERQDDLSLEILMEEYIQKK